MDHKSQILQTLRGFDQEKIPNKVPKNLPLLDEYIKNHSKPQLFANLEAVFIQHHLGPLIPKVEALVKKGLKRKNCWFVDIPYSTNEKVRTKLIKLGYPDDQMTRPFTDPIEDYDENQSGRVAFLLLKLARRNLSGKLLVIDDGAYFARFLKKIMLHSPKLKRVFMNACVVEQTTRGHRFLIRYGKELVEFFQLRIVSIARCKTKIEFESPFIDASVARALMNALRNKNLNKFKHIADIGYGAVEEATVAQLTSRTKGSEIDIVEINKNKLEQIKNLNDRCSKNHFRGMKELDVTKRYELVIGCTGYNSFRIDQRKLLANKAILASGSSAAVEFNRAGFVELADRYPHDKFTILEKENTRRKGIHATITLSQEDGRKFSFLNAGFPVNFDGRMEGIPIRIIQATHTLLFAAAMQSLRQKKPGFRKIHEKTDKEILIRASEML